MTVHTFIWPTLNGERIGVRLGPFTAPVVIDGFVIQASGGLTVAQPRQLEDEFGQPLPPEEAFRFAIGNPGLIELGGADPDWAFATYDGFELQAVTVEEA